MSMYTIDLSRKELNFTIQAFESQIRIYEQQMATNGISEDQYSDAANDAQFLREFVSKLRLLKPADAQS